MYFFRDLLDTSSYTLQIRSTSPYQLRFVSMMY